MAVSTFQQTDFNTQPGPEFGANIDADISVLTRLSAMFAPHAQTTPDMTVVLDPGHVFDGTTLTELSAQSSAAITPPIANPRIDRIVIDQFTGAVSVVTGSESVSPVPPSIPAGTSPVAQVLLQTSSVTITNAMITDERDFSFLGGGITGVTAGTGLTGGGTSGNVTISLISPVAVANGGTGATAAGPTAANNIGALASANNLSDLASAPAARTNLGLGSIATQDANAVAITGGTITGLPSPTSPSDAATKAYVDASISGLSVRDSVAAASAGPLPNSPTYDNGASGVGVTLRAGSNGALIIDDYTVQTDDRLLIKGQAAGLQNGIYTVSNTGGASAPYILTRATDADSEANLVSGIFVFTEQGTTNTGAGFVLTTPNPITVGTTALTFTQFSGAGEITAGTGLAKSGNTISLLPPTASTIGGVQAVAPVAHQWINSISTSGVPAASQPGFADLSGQATLAQLPSIGNNTVLGNNSGASASPTPLSASNILDMIGAAEGDLLFRGAGGWVVLPPGASGQVLQSSGSSADPRWVTPSGGSFVIAGYINGFGLSNDAASPTAILDVAAGIAADSTNAVMISGPAFTKSTGGAWVAGSGNTGMGRGLTVAASTWYHVFAIINSGAYDVYFDSSSTAANAPIGTTACRYVGSFLTDASAHILAFTQFGQKFLWGATITNLSGGTASTRTPVTVSAPLGFVTFPLLLMSAGGTPARNDNIEQFPGTSSTQFENILFLEAAAATQFASFQGTTNTSGQISYSIHTTNALQAFIFTLGYINPHVSSVI